VSQKEKAEQQENALGYSFLLKYRSRRIPIGYQHLGSVRLNIPMFKGPGRKKIESRKAAGEWQGTTAHGEY
jgi:hypothetical protein